MDAGSKNALSQLEKKKNPHIWTRTVQTHIVQGSTTAACFHNEKESLLKSTVSWGFPGGSVVKNLPAMWETQVRYLAWEVPLEKGMATHFSILTWRIPWTEEPGRPRSVGSQS